MKELIKILQSKYQDLEIKRFKALDGYEISNESMGRSCTIIIVKNTNSISISISRFESKGYIDNFSQSDLISNKTFEIDDLKNLPIDKIYLDLNWVFEAKIRNAKFKKI